MQRRMEARAFDFSREVAVMGIINRTPDSFFDNGATFELDRAINAAMAAIGDGADFVDVGGVPFGRGPAVSRDRSLTGESRTPGIFNTPISPIRSNRRPRATCSSAARNPAPMW